MKKTCSPYFPIIIAITAFGLVSSGYAQPEKPAIKIQGKSTQRSIKIRWAPNTPTVWHFANQYGYTVERITLSENNKVLPQPIRVTLTKNPLKPSEQKFWEPHMDTDDYVAVAAQAIFGETFELTDNYASDMVKVVNKSREQESRFSFALFAADQSIKAAELSGLYIEDETIAPRAKYLYRVYANIPAEILKVDTGFVYVGLQDYQPLPKVPDMRAQFEDRIVNLSWNGSLLEKTYNSFWVERSDNGGKTFNKITKQPIVNAYPGTSRKSTLIFKTDSIPNNDTRYHYRVMGVSAFGEVGPPSDTVSGVGKPVFAYSAAVETHAISIDQQVALSWSFPAKGSPVLKSFDLLRLDPPTKKYSLVKAGLDKNAREVVDESPRSSNYYVIRAWDRYGRSNNSFPYLVQLEDSIPPMPPVSITGTIDTLGRVFLNWEANREEDLLGYNVYRSNFTSEEYIQVPGPIWTTNSYVDTIKLNNLSEKIYYKLRAVDKRFNPSGFSEVLALEKPDIIPPTPPVFKQIKRDSTGILISWEKSGSEDVDRHLLYRKSDQETEWTLVKSVVKPDTASRYLDESVKHRVMYYYTLIAMDDDGLESIPAPPLNLRWMDTNPFPAIENIFYKIDKQKKRIDLTWTYSEQQVEKFLVYKSKNGGPLVLYKSLEGTTRELIDEYILSDVTVEYRIVAGFTTGEKTRVSKALIVKI
jgi:uncharacterized protein